jgi:alpha-tubulin suppressor-like RCC1 family protein
MKKIFILTTILLSFFSCKKSDNSNPNNNGNSSDGITVTTENISDIKTILATASSKVIVDSTKNSITMKGVVWSTTTSPTISLSTRTEQDATKGTYTSSITDLQSNTKYYVRAYAKDKNGNVIYGNEISFTTKMGWKKIKAGCRYVVGIKNDGTLWAWGRNEQGQLGDGTSVSKYTPVQIGNDKDWVDIEVQKFDANIAGFITYAIKDNGSLWGWGSGYLGDGTNISKYIPTKIGNDLWKQISVGNAATFGIKADGSVWAWGGFVRDPNNINNRTTELSPKQLIGISNCKHICCNYESAFYIKNDGSLWEYGYGLLQNTPVSLHQIGIENNWLEFQTAVGGGAIFAVILSKQDKSRWGIGSGSNGIFGTGNNANYTTVTNIGTNIPSNAVDISCGSMTYFINQDGTLWGTGPGYLGDGTPYNNSRFVFMKASEKSNWIKVVSVPGNSNTFAIQTNGSLWMCGDNSNPSLFPIGVGVGGSSSYPSFTLID